MNCCDIQAGMLRCRSELQRETLVSDGIGGGVKLWEKYADVWAYIKPTSGREALFGMQLEHVITHDVFIRYRSGVVASDKLVYNDREFNIVSIINVEERNVWLRLRCEEGRAV